MESSITIQTIVNSGLVGVESGSVLSNLVRMIEIKQGNDPVSTRILGGATLDASILLDCLLSTIIQLHDAKQETNYLTRQIDAMNYNDEQEMRS